MSNNYSFFKKTIAALLLLIVTNLSAQECVPPNGLFVHNTGMAHARFYWTALPTAPLGGYDWQLTLNGNTTVLQSGTTQAATLLATGLQTATQYTLKLRSHCSEASQSTWLELNFTTKTAFTTGEGQIGFGTSANALFGASYGPMMYAGIAQRNGSVANMLFTDTEMQALNIPVGANITGVAFDKVNGAYGGDTYPDLRLRMFAKNSSAQAPLSMTTTYGDIQASHAEVMDNPAYDLPATIGWIDFNFETPIAYTGGGFELATAMYQNGQTAQFSNFIVWQYTGGLKDYMVGAWPINTVPMNENLVLSHNSGGGQYKERPNIKFYYDISNAVTGITVAPYNGAAAVITQNQGTLQLAAQITPGHVNQEKIWTIISGSQYATINANGQVTAIANGTVTVQATAADNATITDTIEITISGQLQAATGVDVTVAGNAPATITIDNGTLQLSAAVTPAETSQAVTWSIVSGSAFATVDANGLVTATENGTVVVKATSTQTTSVTDTIEITITGQVTPVASLEITVANGAEQVISTDGGTLQLVATVTPSNSNQNVVWSTISGNAFAYMTQDGVVHAINNGTAVIQAVSAENNTILDTIEITISGQVVAVSGLTITVANDAQPVISTDGGTLQLVATVTPSNSNQNVVWSTVSGNAFAYMTQDGVVHAINNGTAVIQAVSAENNTILDTIEITVSGQVVAVSGLTITVANDAEPVITTDGGTLQLIATVTPSNSNQNVVWSTISGNAFAYMTQDGVVHAINNGTAVIQAVSTENNTIVDTIEITISGQVVAVTGLTITVENDAEPVITTSGGTLQLVATVTPSNSNQNVVWSTISGNAFAYMTQDGVVHAINNGTAVIQAVSAENNTILDTIEITVSGQVLGLEEFNKNEVIIYPNPAQTTITLQSQNEITNVVIYSAEGRKVLESRESTIDISSLSKGYYILTTTSQDGRTVTKKIVKN